MLHSSQSAPVVDGKVMEFVIFAIESAAQKLGIPAPTLYNPFGKTESYPSIPDKWI